jgi:hypothetical protein
MGQVSIYGATNNQRVQFFRGSSAQPESVGRLGGGTDAIPLLTLSFPFAVPPIPCHRPVLAAPRTFSQEYLWETRLGCSRCPCGSAFDQTLSHRGETRSRAAAGSAASRGMLPRCRKQPPSSRALPHPSNSVPFSSAVARPAVCP